MNHCCRVRRARRQGSAGAHHHRAPRGPRVRCADRHQVRRYLPLGHPPGPRGLGRGDLPDGPGPRDRRRRRRGRLRRHQVRRRRPGGRRLHGRLLPRVRQLQGRPGAVLHSSGHVGTYNAIGKDGEPTYGGYAEKIVVDENFTVRIPDGIALDVAAPLLCAGITTYSPLKHWNAGPGKKVAVVGLGGLGHMGVKIAHALGAEVTVLSQSLRKKDDGLKLGADHYYATSDRDDLQGAAPAPSTSSSPRSRPRWTSTPTSSPAEDGRRLGERRRPRGARRPQPLLGDRRPQDPRRLRHRRHPGDPGDAGLLRRARPRRRDRADRARTEINEAYERVLASDVRYRFVIDTSTI